MTYRHILVMLLIGLLAFNCTMQQQHHDEKIVDEKLPAPKDPYHKLCQYWEVTDAENPTFRDVYDHQQDGIYNYPGIVFMTDSTFLENPRSTMRYGKFQFKGKVITANFDDGKKAVYNIKEIQGDSMVLVRVEKDHTATLYVKGNQTFWGDASLNPYNKKNSEWRIKPGKEENKDELRARLKGCVQFYEYFFSGHAESESNEVDLLGLPSCFKWYHGGILVQGPKNLDKKWINCFYSEEQAMDARQIMEDALTTKKYDWDTTQTNWLKQTANVLKQIHDKM